MAKRTLKILWCSHSTKTIGKELLNEFTNLLKILMSLLLVSRFVRSSDDN